MCGYIRRVTDSPAVRDLLTQIGLNHLVGQFTGSGQSEVEHFYPAFGGDPHRQIRQLIIPGSEGATRVDATWWYDCQPIGDTLRPGKRTTFNARNLDSPYWRQGLRYHRALVVATGLGESKRINGKKHQFLVEGEQPFLLGALYRPFENGCVSCAVITRDAHPRFNAYHDKAFPCFLPPNAEFIDQWLNETGEVPNAVANYLNHPRIVVPLRVSPVKAFKHGHVDQFADALKADAD